MLLFQDCKAIAFQKVTKSYERGRDLGVAIIIHLEIPETNRLCICKKLIEINFVGTQLQIVLEVFAATTAIVNEA